MCFIFEYEFHVLVNVSFPQINIVSYKNSSFLQKTECFFVRFENVLKISNEINQLYSVLGLGPMYESVVYK